MKLIYIYYLCNLCGHTAVIAGQHNRFFDTSGFHPCNGISRLRFDTVGNNDMSHIDSIYSYVDYRSRFLARFGGYPSSLH